MRSTPAGTLSYFGCPKQDFYTACKRQNVALPHYFFAGA
jgi:hypothetical protein